MPETLTVEHAVTMAAPAEDAFDCVHDVARWPQWSTPIAYAERSEATGATDLVKVWALRGDESVRVWSSRRELDRAGLRIAFRNEPGGDAPADARGEWVFREQPGGTTEVTLRHEVAVESGAAERVREELDRHVTAQLAELKAAAERRKELEELTVDFEDPLFVAGAAEDAYELLYEADKWPERIPHVSALTMTEKVPGIQFFDMDTRTPDGREHTTRSVRVCFPHTRIVYKQIKLPPLLDAHTGHWLFTPVPEGLIVSARHTATIKPSALHLLGPDATVKDARRYLRKVLSANSMGNLRLAKAFAEERADG
jgi:C7-C12 aromatase (ARO/CYC)